MSLTARMIAAKAAPEIPKETAPYAGDFANLAKLNDAELGTLVGKEATKVASANVHVGKAIFILGNSPNRGKTTLKKWVRKCTNAATVDSAAYKVANACYTETATPAPKKARRKSVGQENPSVPAATAPVATVVAKPKPTPKASRLSQIVLAVPTATFACLLPDADSKEAEKIRKQFALWCNTQTHENWRDAWRDYKQAVTPPRNEPEAERSTPKPERIEPKPERSNIIAMPPPAPRPTAPDMSAEESAALSRLLNLRK